MFVHRLEEHQLRQLNPIRTGVSGECVSSGEGGRREVYSFVCKPRALKRDTQLKLV